MNEPNRNVAELSTGELVGRLGEQVSRLVRDELALATDELKEKGKQAGGGAAGVTAWFGVAALVIAAIAALSLVLPVWASALIVGVVLLLIAGALGLIGMRKLKHATPPVPEQAMRSTRRDIEAIKEGAHR